MQVWTVNTTHQYTPPSAPAPKPFPVTHHAAIRRGCLSLLVRPVAPVLPRPAAVALDLQLQVAVGALVGGPLVAGRGVGVAVAAVPAVALERDQGARVVPGGGGEARALLLVITVSLGLTTVRKLRCQASGTARARRDGVTVLSQVVQGRDPWGGGTGTHWQKLLSGTATKPWSELVSEALRMLRNCAPMSCDRNEPHT